MSAQGNSIIKHVVYKQYVYYKWLDQLGFFNTGEMATNDILLRIGKVVRRHREALKMTQEAFADEHKINLAYYGAIERGKQNLTLLNLARIADGIGKPLSQLFREAEKLDENALNEPDNPPRRGRPKGKKSRWQ